MHVAGVLRLGLLGGLCVACATEMADETDASEPAGSPCGPGSCCMPLQIARDESRAFLVDGLLHVDVGATGTPRPDPSDGLGTRYPEEFWSVGAEITLEDGSSLGCSTAWSEPIDEAGPVFASCSGVPPGGLACGSTLRLNVRLTSATELTTGTEWISTCEPTGFAGDGATFDLAVECRQCPELAAQGEPCDHPRGAGCGALGYNHWIDQVQSVSCLCGPPSEIERNWVCPVF